MKLEYAIGLAAASSDVMYDAKILSQSKMTYDQSVVWAPRTKSHERETGSIGPYSAGE